MNEFNTNALQPFLTDGVATAFTAAAAVFATTLLSIAVDDVVVLPMLLCESKKMKEKKKQHKYESESKRQRLSGDCVWVYARALVQVWVSECAVVVVVNTIQKF